MKQRQITDWTLKGGQCGGKGQMNSLLQPIYKHIYTLYRRLKGQTIEHWRTFMYFEYSVVVSPARLRKKIEWVSRMFMLSSSTSIFPSAAAGPSSAARAANMSTDTGILWFVPRRDTLHCFWGDNLEEVFRTAAVNVAILLQKSTSALAAAAELWPQRLHQSGRGARRCRTPSPPIAEQLYYKDGPLHCLRWLIHLYAFLTRICITVYIFNLFYSTTVVLFCLVL